MAAKSDNDARWVRGPDGRVVHVPAASQPACAAEISNKPPVIQRLVTDQGHWPSIELHTSSRWVIGRDPNRCNTAIEHEQISRQHAELSVSETGEVHVFDLGSSNGTYVDHAKAPEKSGTEAQGLVWQPGQRLLLGGENVVYRLIDDRED